MGLLLLEKCVCKLINVLYRMSTGREASTLQRLSTVPELVDSVWQRAWGSAGGTSISTAAGTPASARSLSDTALDDATESESVGMSLLDTSSLEHVPVGHDERSGNESYISTPSVASRQGESSPVFICYVHSSNVLI